MLGAAHQRRYDDLRRLHYPQHRQMVGAHITLFHHLPPSILDELSHMMRQLAAEMAPPQAEVRGIMDLGSGTALFIHSPDLLDMRAMIADHFGSMIAMQDQARPRLHITIQNKVSRKEAISLQRRLAQDFQPHPLDIAGLAAHHYRDGPWDVAVQTRFRGSSRPG
jgi:hypothetical protein